MLGWIYLGSFVEVKKLLKIFCRNICEGNSNHVCGKTKKKFHKSELSLLCIDSKDLGVDGKERKVPASPSSPAPPM
jgi:hypothetical protein